MEKYMKTDFITDKYLVSQPERLTYYNLANVSALCIQPRVSYDSTANVTDIWAANEIINQKLGEVFYNTKMGNEEFKITELDIYPVVYLVSKDERKSMRGIEELQNKFILNSALLVYRCVRTIYEDVLTPEGEMTTVVRKQNINYSAIIEQSLDGYVIPLKEIVVMMFNSAINYNRALKWVPHKEMKINLVLPKTLKDEIDSLKDDSEIDPFLDSVALMDFIEREYKDEMESIVNKFNADNLTIRIDDDSTAVKYRRNMPNPYKDIMTAYKTSFRCNPFE